MEASQQLLTYWPGKNKVHLHASKLFGTLFEKSDENGFPHPPDAAFMSREVLGRQLRRGDNNLCVRICKVTV